MRAKNIETSDQVGATAHRIKSTQALNLPYLRPNQVIEVYPISRRTLSNWQRRHVLPYFRIGRTCLFKRSDIEAALERFRISAAGE